MVSVYVLPMPEQPLASVTLTVIEKTPVWVGVPERTPPDDSETPDGNEPLLIVKIAGVCVPTPLCVKVKLPLSGVLYVPLLELGFVTVMVWQEMVSVCVGPVPVQPFESVTLTVIANVPGTCGVPERTALADSARPAGNVPLATENVAVPIAPLCVNVALKGESTVPVLLPGFVTVMV